jgi:glycerol-3-phosphate acyltransferase PlsX
MASPRIALDVMGGDDAPGAILEGALAACAGAGSARLAPERILLVGDRARMEAGLAERGGNPGFELEHATQVVEMGDSPAQALRAKPDNSIARCVKAVREGRAAAVVGMGNTGACVGAATLGLGTIPGVRRPGIAVTLALTGEPLTILDMGANIAPKPDHLYQYGAMGSTYATGCLGQANPRVGLLNVGEEKGKGTDLLKEAYELLEGSRLCFVGNVEGGDIFRGVCDVVVTDGFTGNVILKLLEQFAAFFMGKIVAELARGGAGPAGGALRKLEASIDYKSYGGALLLGVNGVVVIGHGRSDAKAVANALAQAARAVDAGVPARIERGLAPEATGAAGTARGTARDSSAGGCTLRPDP